MLKLSQTSVEEQFFKGMAPDTQLEADRIGAERPLNDLVDSLEKVEKRKAEMRLGLSNRDRSRYNQSRDIIISYSITSDFTAKAYHLEANYHTWDNTGAV